MADAIPVHSKKSVKVTPASPMLGEDGGVVMGEYAAKARDGFVSDIAPGVPKVSEVVTMQDVHALDADGKATVVSKEARFTRTDW